jgi:thiazole/oxazole-forming peptide maturase SagC family component
VKRGSTEFQIEGERAAEVVHIVLAAAENGELTSDEIEALFAGCDRPAVRVLVQQLRQRNIIVDRGEYPSGASLETPIDIFYWHFGRQAVEVIDRLNSWKIAVLGVNGISQQLAGALHRSGVTNVDVVDVRLLRNVRLFDNDDDLNVRSWPIANKIPLRYSEWREVIESELPHCIVATSDFGGQHLLREWNVFCLERSITFLPVVLQDLVGYVGPLVIPGQTACLECLRARQNAALVDPTARRAAEAKAFQGQAITGFLPSMASILGDIATVELIKFYSTIPKWNVGTLIEVNMLTSVMTPRKVLRVPRCAVCSTLNRTSSVNLTDNSTAGSNGDFR